MATSSQNTTLSSQARLLKYLGPPTITIGTYYVSQTTGVLSPLAYLPSVLALRLWRRENEKNPSRRGELSPMIYTIASTGTIGLISVMSIQMLVFKGLLTILFPNPETRTLFTTEFGRTTTSSLSPTDLAARATLAYSWQNTTVNFLASFVMAALFEETLKYIPILYAKHLYPPSNSPKNTKKPNPRKGAYLDLALAGALSFGVIENIAFLYQAVEGAGQTATELAVTAVERLVFASAGHLMAAALTALRATRRDFYDHGEEGMSWWRVILPATLLHGCQNFVALSWSAVEGNVGWMHPVQRGNTLAMVLMIGAINVTAGYLVWGEMKELERLDQAADSASKKST